MMYFLQSILLVRGLLYYSVVSVSLYVIRTLAPNFVNEFYFSHFVCRMMKVRIMMMIMMTTMMMINDDDDDDDDDVCRSAKLTTAGRSLTMRRRKMTAWTRRARMEISVSILQRDL